MHSLLSSFSTRGENLCVLVGKKKGGTLGVLCKFVFGCASERGKVKAKVWAFASVIIVV